MKITKFLTLLGSLSALGYLSFHITYENVSAIVEKEAEEDKKNEVQINPIIIHEEDETRDEEPSEEKDDKEILNVITNDYIFVGDSRINSIEQFSKNLGVNIVDFITVDDPDYYWMVNTGADTLESVLKDKQGSYNIVFNLGIKDLNNIKMYIDFFNHLAYKYPKQNIFVLGIGPLDEVKAVENNITNINNDDIYSFNIDMIKGLNKDIHVIHIFQELIVNGYDTTNGYYLTEDTSMSLLKFIQNHIKDLQNDQS